MFARRLILHAVLALTLFLITGFALADGPVRHHVSGLPTMQTPAPTGVVVLKLEAGADTDKAATLERLSAKISPWLSDAVLLPRFAGLAKSMAHPDLSRYHQLQAKGLTRTELLKLVGSLNADPAVEVAFLEPVAVPAALGFDAFTGAVPETRSAGSHLKSDTPDYESDQGYLDAAPLGVGALSMRAQAGALASGVTVIDIEGGWLWTHEDLPDPVHELGVQVDNLAWRNHGTAVIAEIRGEDNGFGVSGIAPQCDVGNASIGGGAGTAWALAAATAVLEAGDLILIELHAPGPNANGQGQFGYVPMEFWPDNFDLIRAATEKGIIVCEAAGNGYQNLDHPVYMDLFDRTVRDSGAIMCGATAGPELYSADFSNNGNRVDLNGWGWYVTTAGYGDLQGGEDESLWYTAVFSGTSSASPIVTGAVASLQGMIRERFGFDLDARLARDLLLETGTPMVSGSLIGNRPDLVAAYAHADTVVGRIVGTVTDQISGLPVPGVLVQVADQGSFTTTDDLGQWALPLDTREGTVDLVFSSYYYDSLETSPPIIPGTTVTLNVALEPLDLIDIRGQVTGPAGPLADVFVTPTNQPVSGTTTAADGTYTISSVPALHDFGLLFEGADGHGARFEVVSTSGLTEDAIASPVLPAISEDFSSGPGGFMADDGLWSHGAPPAAVTGGAFSGLFCWGIGMGGPYLDDQADTVTSPSYNLSGVAGDPYFLSFHFFSATENGFDGVRLEIESGGEWIQAHPLEGYPDFMLSSLGNNPGWSGNSGRWQGTVFDISDHTDADFRFRLIFASDGGVTADGWFFDGIAFGSNLNASPVPGQDTPAPRRASLEAWPNPFNPQVTIAYAVPQAGNLRVQVMDLRGRLVRTLLDAPVQDTRGELRWDGRGDDGRAAASGVYLVRLEGPGGSLASQRVVLAK